MELAQDPGHSGDSGPFHPGKLAGFLRGGREFHVPHSLVNGQLVAVNKLVYKFHPPRRGDVVVFVTRGNAFGPGPERVFIKRVIAVPGDTVAIANGAVFLNGEPLHEEYIDTAVHGEMEPSP